MQTIHQRARRPALLLLLTATLCWTAACRRDTDVVDPNAVDQHGVPFREVNQWTLDSMRTYYYWNDRMPARPDLNQNPSDFFNSLLYRFDARTRPDGDRFSFISENVDELRANLSGVSKSIGIEFEAFLRARGSEDVILQVLYVQPNSPAARAGVKRGDIIFSVNGERLTRGNADLLLFGLGDTKTYGFATVQVNNAGQATIVDGNVTRQITAVTLQENPVFLDSIYTIGAKKIGYLVYNQFVSGPSGTNTRAFDQQMVSVFNEFAAAGVNEMILDLRYNTGGEVSSAVIMASQLSPRASTSDVFVRAEYNKQIMDQVRRAGQENDLIIRYAPRLSSLGTRLSRLFVITTRRTASASELVINGLRPDMTVVTVGDTTVGKNVGSITIEDKRTPRRINWGLQPIILKLQNRLGQSDFTNGFAPTVRADEPINLRPFGDLNEALLANTVAYITGARAGRVGATQQPLPSVGSSLTRKAGGSNMFVSKDLLKR